MKLILVRHAKSIDNEKEVLQHPLEGELSDAGIEQAKRLAGRFSNDKIDVIIISPADRTCMTAQETSRISE